MDYPRNPTGLRWDEHYEMANQIYFAYAHGGAAHLPRTQKEEARPATPRRIVAWPRKRGGKRIA